MSRPTVIDLFCGAGGLSEGLRQAGFDIRAGNDIDAHAGATFAATHPDTKFLPGSIYELTPQDFLDATGLAKGQLILHDSLDFGWN